MAVTKTVITTVVTRAWNEIEPKLLAAAAGGVTATGLIHWLGVIGVHLTLDQAGLAVTLLAVIAGWIKASTSKTAVPVATVEPVVAPVVVEPPAPVA